MMQRRTKILLSGIPLTLLTLWLDALAPGQGAFYNPLFFFRSQLARLDTAWRQPQAVDASTDERLAACIQFTADTVLTQSQEQLRGVLTGKSEAFTLQQLGPPTCVMADGVYRWLSQSGLSLDITITDAEVEDARLSR